ncbi:MAG: hypothetical protein ACRC1D_01845, partial [Culicoidibacterales bacterium]
MKNNILTTVLTFFLITSVAADAHPIRIGNTTYANQKELVKSGKRCGFKEPPAEQLQRADEIVKNWLKENGSNLRAAHPTIVVDTYFHVIPAGVVGVLTDKKLQDQYDVF